MKTTRRTFVRAAGAGGVGSALRPARTHARHSSASTSRPFDVAVVVAGGFGSWTAHELGKAGRRVVLVDGYGPGNARASSGGHTLFFFIDTATPEIYTRWSM